MPSRRDDERNTEPARGRSNEKGTTNRDASRGRSLPRQDRVTAHFDIDDDDDSSSSNDSNEKSRLPSKVKGYLKKKTAWTKTGWSWPKIKPVIRCAVAAWVAALLFDIPSIQKWMGQAAFLVLVASFFSPPSDPLIAVLEREFFNVLFVTVMWAWTCLGLKLADLTRTKRDPTATLYTALDGRFIEAAPNVIIGIFIAIGSMVPLYIKGKLGASPYFFATIFACILLDISMTTAVFVPYPYYDIGRMILLPLGIHACIALLSSIFIFPYTVSAQYTTRIQDVIAPLADALSNHVALLQLTPGSVIFTELAATIQNTVADCESGLLSVAAAGRLLENDLIYCRFSPEDFRVFHNLARRLTGRAHGLGTYFTLIDPNRETFPTRSQPNTPAPGTPALSRSHSLERVRSRPPTPSTPNGTHTPPSLHTPSISFSRSASGQDLQRHSSREHHKHHRRGRSHSRSRSHWNVHVPHLLHNTLLNLSTKPLAGRHEHPVGVFESQRYLNLEAKRFHDPRHDGHSQTSTELLRDCCEGLLERSQAGITGISSWLGTVREGRFNVFRREKFKQRREERVKAIQVLREELSQALEKFRANGRFKVMDPYLPAFNLKEAEDDEDFRHDDIPSHRHLFRCYVYQYHLIQVAEIVIEALDTILDLEKRREDCKLWTPVKRFFRWNRHDVADNIERDEDDDPDVIQGARREFDPIDLNVPKRRDPDALPPRNAAERIMSMIYYGVTNIWTGNSLFALKVGLMSAAMALPFFFKGSATWAYENRWAWSIIMCQITMARFRGDTAFGLSARIIATFCGGIIGMGMWYVSTGGGLGNAYGLAAVCAVCFPCFFYIRLYCPLPAVTLMVSFVTASLVLGYSYQDHIQQTPASPGPGWPIAWRRFVFVAAGVFAAFLASFLPPTMTLRRYQRHLLSTTAGELGTIYCSIISFATDRHLTPDKDNIMREAEIEKILRTLIATRSKLRRSEELRTNIGYEFSLQGRWPRERYLQIFQLQTAISYSLSHLMSVLKHLEPAWTRAYLKRARLSDPDFQGDVLAVMSLISIALRTGLPLPQVTPCPLLDRFTMHHHGLDVIHRESEEDYGLPRTLTLETLMDEQYMMFCVGISTAFGIMNRLDRLMLAAKEILGENYHIQGLGLVGHSTPPRVPMFTIPSREV